MGRPGSSDPETQRGFAGETGYDRDSEESDLCFLSSQGASSSCLEQKELHIET